MVDMRRVRDIIILWSSSQRLEDRRATLVELFLERDADKGIVKRGCFFFLLLELTLAFSLP